MNNLIDDLKSFELIIQNLKSENISNINLSKTILFIVDMNNGFAKSGALYSQRVENLIDPIASFANFIGNNNCPIIAFTDSHNPDSIELKNYPKHCLVDDIESDIIDELKSINGLTIVPKNSTNGFFALENFDYSSFENIIIVGDCTDICIYQFATALKAYFNHLNIDKNIIVPVDLVDTYDIPNIHSANLMNLVFLNSMIQNGINVVKTIDY
jgi:nicotinamidase-related amidase